MTQPTLTLDQALAAIDFEIDRHRTEHNAPGWTPWAITTTLGGLAWLITEEFKSGTVTVQSVLMLYITFALAVDGIGNLIKLLTYRAERFDMDPRFFWLTHQIAHMRITCLISITHYLLLLFFVLWCFDRIHGFYALFIPVYIIAVLAIYTFALVISFKRWLLTVGKGIPLWAKYILGGALLLLLGAAIDLFLGDDMTLPALGVSDYRVAAMALIGYLLLMNAPFATSRNPELVSLTECRRKLTEGEFSPSEIPARLRSIRGGMTALEVLQASQEQIAPILSRCNQLCDDGIARLQEYAESATPQSKEIVRQLFSPKGSETKSFRKTCILVNNIIAEQAELLTVDVKAINRAENIPVDASRYVTQFLDQQLQFLKDVGAKVETLQQRLKSLRESVGSPMTEERGV